LVFREFGWTRKTAFRYGVIATLGGAAVFCAAVPFGIATRHGTIVGAALQEVPLNFAFAGVVTLFLVVGTGQWKRLVVPATLRFLGRISYGLYLIHFLVFDEYDVVSSRYFPRLAATDAHGGPIWIRFAAASTCAILIAWLSRETIEEFFMSLGKSGSHARPQFRGARA
jgi:peptidoglycan/LPS O-acetylase OafA/YrhL